jgi:parallel beta-helix repeat protein
VDAAPEGATFLLLPGVYSMQSVQPKNYDTFIGEKGVILNGSQLLSFEVYLQESNLWVAEAVAGVAPTGQCQSARPLCGYDQDLFIDGQLQTPVSALAGLQPGSWYFDRGNNSVYISTDPTGHAIELGMAEFAFYGVATGVEVEDLTVQQYANPAQTGAVGGYKDGTGWIVNNVESEWNHGTGISLGPSSQILNSFSLHNGQMGVAIVGGLTSSVINNEIAWNNYAGYAMNWEAGGSKFWNTTNLLVQSNYVHDNNGPGLWTDYDNVGTVYEYNTVENNAAAGIQHEISYNATIANNIVTGNADNSTATLWNSQIVLANSQNVDVSGNTVQVPLGGGNGIGLINEERGTGSLGVWVAANNSVQNNTVTYIGATGVSGLVDYLGGNTAVGNSFDNDVYVLKGGGVEHWMWFNEMNWGQFQNAGQEGSGTCCN